MSQQNSNSEKKEKEPDRIILFGTTGTGKSFQALATLSCFLRLKREE